MVDSSLMLVCPSCRKPDRAYRLNRDLECENAGCGQVYPRLGTLPVVAPGKLSPYTDGDYFEGLPTTEANWAAGIDQVDVGSEAWRMISRLGMFLGAQFDGQASSPGNFYDALDAWALPLLGARSRLDWAVDLGCGTGPTTMALSRLAKKGVVGLDASPLFLHAATQIEAGLRGQADSSLIAAELTTERQLKIRPFSLIGAAPKAPIHWICGNAGAPPIATGRFDVVSLVNVIDSVAQPGLVLSQAWELLRPGGVLLLASADAWGSNPTHPKNWLADDIDDWGRVLSNVGMTIVAQTDDLRWSLRYSSRMNITYRVHATIAEKGAEIGPKTGRTRTSRAS